MSGAVVTASLLREPAKAARRHLEADLQHAVMEFLAVALPSDAVAHHSPGEGLRGRRAQRDLKRSGHQKGWPDVEIVWRGRVIFVELKAKGGSLQPEQRTMHNRLQYCGADVVTCRSVECVEESLLELGVPLRARVSA